MSRPTTTASAGRAATGAVLGILAIPFVSVSSVVLVADVSSSTHSGHAAWELLALVVGTAAGLGVVRIIRAAAGVCAVAAAQLARARDRWAESVPPVASSFRPVPIALPVRSPRRAPIVRRGPPLCSE